ncbi:MAG: NAD-dependent epimerase/dehydratase family protein [Actinomycetes bacterium]
MGQVILVTGASRHLGGTLARRLAELPDVDRVVGVDVVPPSHDLGLADFVRADIRNPVIGHVMSSSEIDTVVHMGVIATPRQAGGRSVMKEINVIGTMQLLAACQKSSTMRKLVVKSSTSVYGAGPRDPAMFSEGMDPRDAPRSGWAKDNVEVEGYVRGFSRRRPDVTVTTLRLANIIGPRITTVMTDYFSLPVVPTVLGHDARLQFVHEDDSIDAIIRATVEDVPGTFNVAGDGVLMLSQAIRRAGRVTLPIAAPLIPAVGRMTRQMGVADFSSEQVRYLTWGRVVDTTRMRSKLEFEPEFTTLEAFDDFVAARGLNSMLPRERVAAIEATVVDLLGRGGERSA